MHESIYDRFLDRFIEVTKENAKIGDPFSEETYQGSQVSKVQSDRVLSYIEDGKASGARLLHGGLRHGSQGYYLEPTVFADVLFPSIPLPHRFQTNSFLQVNENMRIMREEIFGPVAAISKFSSEEEVIKLCNASEYGLAAAIFTENVKRAHIVARKLQCGMVWINSSNDSHYGIPFGGYKSSGIGRELGKYALDAYTQPKAIHVNLGTEL